MAVWPYGWHLHNWAPPCPRGNPSSGRTGNTITHAARQAATRYRKAEIDNAGGPPAPYPNLDTRPAPAPGSSRQDPVLPSVSTIFADLYASPLHPFPLTRLYLVGIGKFRREKLWFVAIIRIIFSSLIFYLPSVLPSCLKDKKFIYVAIYIRFSSSISSYSFVLRWNLSERNYSLVRANNQDPP